MAVTKTMLKSLLRSRLCTNGRMTVPRHKSDKNLSLDISIDHKGAQLRSMLRSEKETVRKFMLDYFYKDASVPKALTLKETCPKFELLQDELNLMLDSPACIVSIDKSTNKIVSAIINTVWQVDNDFDAFKVDGIEYLNLAAVIAHEVTNDPLMRIVIWRDYQFQLIYHLLQVKTSKQKSI